jgi:hypothetical protein
MDHERREEEQKLHRRIKQSNKVDAMIVNNIKNNRGSMNTESFIEQPNMSTKNSFARAPEMAFSVVGDGSTTPFMN